MDMHLTPNDWPGVAGKSPLPVGGARPLDWHGLAARLAAAAACRDALPALPVADGDSASFDPVSARRLMRFDGAALDALAVGGKSVQTVCEIDEAHSLRAVNRVDSVGVKPGAPIAMDAAGTVKTGDRGLQ
ncbi:MAG: hypothetical protein KGN34_07490 [Sphingomonadales bacterium]|nr:hypothetical protein [Sphingomonadales bacterium]